MKYPWHELKQLEIDLTDMIFRGDLPNGDHVNQLRMLVEACSASPDAEQAICYHGSKSILAQLDGKISEAIYHRDVESQKIRRAYELEEENPTDGWSLQNYREADIQKRKMIIQILMKKST